MFLLLVLLFCCVSPFTVVCDIATLKNCYCLFCFGAVCTTHCCLCGLLFVLSLSFVSRKRIWCPRKITSPPTHTHQHTHTHTHTTNKQAVWAGRLRLGRASLGHAATWAHARSQPCLQGGTSRFFFREHNCITSSLNNLYNDTHDLASKSARSGTWPS